MIHFSVPVRHTHFSMPFPHLSKERVYNHLVLILPLNDNCLSYMPLLSLNAASQVSLRCHCMHIVSLRAFLTSDFYQQSRYESSKLLENREMQPRKTINIVEPETLSACKHSVASASQHWCPSRDKIFLLLYLHKLTHWPILAPRFYEPLDHFVF